MHLTHRPTLQKLQLNLHNDKAELEYEESIAERTKMRKQNQQPVDDENKHKSNKKGFNKEGFNKEGISTTGLRKEDYNEYGRDAKVPETFKILGWCPAGSVLPHGEKVPL